MSEKSTGLIKVTKAMSQLTDWFGRRAEDSYTFYDPSLRTVGWENGHEQSLSSHLLGSKDPAQLKNTARILQTMFRMIGVEKRIKSVPTAPLHAEQLQVPIHMLRDEDTGEYTMDARKADSFVGLALHNAGQAALQTPSEYGLAIKAGKTKGRSFDLGKYMFTLLNSERTDMLMSKKNPGYMKFVQKYKDEQFGELEPMPEDQPQHMRFLDLVTRLIRFPKQINEAELVEFQQPLEAIGRLIKKYGGIPKKQEDCLQMSRAMARIITDFVPVPPTPPPPPPMPGPPDPEAESEQQPGECSEPQEGEQGQQSSGQVGPPPEETENNPNDDWNKPEPPPEGAGSPPEKEEEEEEDPFNEQEEDQQPADSSENSDEQDESSASDQGDSDEPEQPGDPNDSEGQSDQDSDESGNADQDEQSDQDSPKNDESEQEPADDSSGSGSSGSSSSKQQDDSDQNDDSDDDDSGSTDANQRSDDDPDSNEGSEDPSDSNPADTDPDADDSSSDGSGDDPDDDDLEDKQDSSPNSDSTNQDGQDDQDSDERDRSDDAAGAGDDDNDPDDDSGEGDSDDEPADSDDDSTAGEDPESDDDSDPDEDDSADGDPADSDRDPESSDDEQDTEDDDQAQDSDEPGDESQDSEAESEASDAEAGARPEQEDAAGVAEEPDAGPQPPSREERKQQLNDLAKTMAQNLFEESDEEELDSDQQADLEQAFDEITQVQERQNNFELDLSQTGVVEGDRDMVSWSIEPGNEARYKEIRKHVDLVKAGVLRKLFSRQHKENQFVIKGMKSGRFDTNKLAEAVQGVPTVYERQGQVTTNKVCVGILIDESGSMSYGGYDSSLAVLRNKQPHGSAKWHELNNLYQDSNKIGKARQAAIFLNECFGKLVDVQLFIYGHSADQKAGEYVRSGGYGFVGNKSKDYDSSTDMYVYREPGARTSPYGLGSCVARANNRDGKAILLTGMRMRKFTKDPGILVVISDGQPNAIGYDGQASIQDTRKQVSAVQRMDITVIQVAIEGGIPSEQMFDHHINMTDIKTLPTDLVKFMSKKISKMIKNTTKL